MEPSGESRSQAGANAGDPGIPPPPRGMSYRRDEDGWMIRAEGWGKPLAIGFAVVVFGGTAVMFSVLLAREWSAIGLYARVLRGSFMAALLLIGAAWGYSQAAPVVYRISGGVLTCRAPGLFRQVVRTWSAGEILHITADGNSVQMLFARDGRWQRAQLSVRDVSIDYRSPDLQAPDRSRWLADVLRRLLQLGQLPDDYDAPQPAAGESLQLDYGHADARAPAVHVFTNRSGDAVMRVNHCGVWHRNEPRFVAAIVLTLFAIYVTVLRGPDGHPIPAVFVPFGVVALVSWANVLWASRSFTLIRAKDEVVTIYRGTPLGVTKKASLTPQSTRELVVRSGANIVAAQSAGYDLPLLTETDQPTQEAVLLFMREALWHVKPVDPERAPPAVPRVQPGDLDLRPLCFRACDGGWELVRPRGGRNRAARVLIGFFLAAGLSWPLLHFHLWSHWFGIAAAVCVWVVAPLLLENSITGMVLPTRITFDGDSVTRTRPRFTGLQRELWRRWQIDNLHVVVVSSGRRPTAAIRLRTRNGRSALLLSGISEQPLRRAAELLACSLGMKPRLPAVALTGPGRLTG